jgi:hypothetical protein
MLKKYKSNIAKSAGRRSGRGFSDNYHLSSHCPLPRHAVTAAAWHLPFTIMDNRGNAIHPVLRTPMAEMSSHFIWFGKTWILLPLATN